MRSDRAGIVIVCAATAVSGTPALAAAAANSIFSGGDLPSAGAAPDADQRAVFELSINTEGKGTVLAVLRGGDALLPVGDLSEAGLRDFAGTRTTIDGREYVSLLSLRPAVTFDLDEKALALRLTADPELLGRVVIDLRAAARPKDLELRRDNSGFFNYSAQADNSGAVGAFAEAGASLSGNLVYTGWSRLPTGELVRGLSSVTIDETDRLRRWVFGDSVHGGTLLGGGGTLFGLSVQREYSLNPYYLRSPLPSTRGFASTPSTLEVYVNGQLVRKQAIAPGSYDVLNLPLSSGDGSYRTVLRDAFGRATELDNSFYYSTGVLSKGLQEYGYSFGLQRSKLATDSFSYDQPAFLGSHRIGLTDSLTAGARFELTEGMASGGAQLTGRLPVGEVELGLAGSGGSHHSGLAASASYLYGARYVSFGVLGRVQSDAYANLSLAPADDRPLLQTNAFASLRVSGRLGLAAEGQFSRSRDSGDTVRISLRSDLTVFRSGALWASIGRSTGNTAAGTEVAAGFTWFFGDLASASGGVTGNAAGAGANAVVQRSLGDRSGLGYRVSATQDPRVGGSGEAELSAQGDYGRLVGTYDRVGRTDAASVSASGGMVFIGGDLFLSRAVQNGYALLEVPGVPGVRGMVNNQVIGTTDRRGNLLLPNLIPYYGNRISINPVDLPLDREIGVTEKLVATPLRGGALVRFDAPKLSFLTGELAIDEGGVVRVPAFGELKVRTPRGERSSPIGRTGQFALEDVPAGTYPAQIETGDGACELDLVVPESTAVQLDLGRISCKAQTRVAGRP